MASGKPPVQVLEILPDPPINPQTYTCSVIDNIMPRLYIRPLLCFPCEDLVAKPENFYSVAGALLNFLQNSLAKTASEFPLMAGLAVDDEKKPGRLLVRTFSTSSVVFRVRDFTTEENAATYDMI